MSGQILIAGLAVLAGTATAIVSMIVTSRSQRIAVREQQLWQARANTYLALESWVQKSHEWRDCHLQEPPPPLDPDTTARMRIYASPYVRHHLVGMQQDVRTALEAGLHQEWERFYKLQDAISSGWGIDLTTYMRDELVGRRNEFAVTRDEELRLRWRERLTTRWLIFKERRRMKKAGILEPPSQADE
jgi:hypothetical protein